MSDGQRNLMQILKGEAPALPRSDRAEEPGLPEGSVTVSDVVLQVERLISQNMGDLVVVGEVSSFKRWRNGNWYFDLRDSRSVLPAVMRPNHQARVAFAPEDGVQVVVHGRVVHYRQQSRVQLMVTRMVELGRGPLIDALERIKARLDAEGLFDQSRKRPLPMFPRRVGIVTSPQGAALHDVIKVLRARSPGVSVLLSPTRVQGNGASRDIAEALRRLDGLGRCDVIVIGRGGGSLEDLMSFNMEVVARAIAGCQTPVISSVGHETDVTLADLVADARAATPSHAAEIAVAHRAQLVTQMQRLARSLSADMQVRLLQARQAVHDKDQRTHSAMRAKMLAQQRRVATLGSSLMRHAPERALAERKARLSSLNRRLESHHPRQAVHQGRAALAQHALRLVQATLSRRREQGQRLRELAARLHALSPLAVLDRGYALVEEAGGGLVTQAAATSVGDALRVRFADGSLKVRIEEVTTEVTVVDDDGAKN